MYSLFPLYTEDTLVYLPELVGKWQAGRFADEYIIIQASNENEVASEQEKPTDSIVGEKWVARFVGEPSIKVGEKVVTNRDSIWMYYDRIYSKIDQGNHNTIRSLMDSSAKMRELLLLLADEEEALSTILNSAEIGLDKLISDKKPKFKGTVSVGGSKSYRMIYQEGDERTEYTAHLVRIGKDYFLDILPDAEQSDYAFGAIMLPTHTFLRIDLDKDNLNIQRFDLERMAELFERNQVRLRHENVDGTMVITAKPKELQSFIKRYALKKGVFEEKEVFKRIGQ
ncbi:hypothetical protein BFP71_09390 [Roseivirga misakiensis]|uniref:Uncharacterized protein n=1 Tax=Roseivirga misakiensis TaxID=1563681 RepID=A0A1E5SKV8_9BACT|nr:hypothetical protein BFP71_09390 [Roseivirga misakiensis]